jgi:hypothetical protein
MRWRRAFQCCSSDQVEDEPKDCKVLRGSQVQNLFELCQQNPQMLIQVMQMDPRFIDVFKDLTGIDLNDVQESPAKQEE